MVIKPLYIYTARKKTLTMILYSTKQSKLLESLARDLYKRNQIAPPPNPPKKSNIKIHFFLCECSEIVSFTENLLIYLNVFS